jgi:hypothetical protein
VLRLAAIVFFCAVVITLGHFGAEEDERHGARAEHDESPTPHGVEQDGARGNWALRAVLLVEIGVEPMGGTTADFENYLAAELKKWGEVVRVSGAKLD